MKRRGNPPNEVGANTAMIDRKQSKEFRMAMRPAFVDGDEESDAKVVEHQNVRTFERVAKALAEERFHEVAPLVTDDIEFAWFGPPDLPFTRRGRGAPLLLGAIEQLFYKMESQAPLVQFLVAQGDRVVMIAEERGIFKDSRQPYYWKMAQACRFREGRICQVHVLVADIDEETAPACPCQIDASRIR